METRALLKRLLASALFLAAAFSAHAAPVSIGYLSSNDDGSTAVVNDTLNHREWLRFDLTKGLSYAQTLAAIGSGGAYEGFRIAHASDAWAFVNALLGGSSACTETAGQVQQSCGYSGSAEAIRLLGKTYTNLDAVVLAMFLSDNGRGEEVGLLDTYDDYGSTTGFTQMVNEWRSIATADGFARDFNVNWLLFRDATGAPAAVPEPGSLALVALALAGLGAVQRLRRAA